MYKSFIWHGFFINSLLISLARADGWRLPQMYDILAGDHADQELAEQLRKWKLHQPWKIIIMCSILAGFYKELSDGGYAVPYFTGRFLLDETIARPSMSSTKKALFNVRTLSSTALRYILILLLVRLSDFVGHANAVCCVVSGNRPVLFQPIYQRNGEKRNPSGSNLCDQRRKQRGKEERRGPSSRPRKKVKHRP